MAKFQNTVTIQLPVSKTCHFFLRIAKILPIIFREAEMLPHRHPYFGKANSFVILTINLSHFLKHVYIKLWQGSSNFGWLVQFGVYEGGTKSFYTQSIWCFLQLFQWGMWAAFHSYSYNLYPGYGYWWQFEEMASAIARDASNNCVQLWAENHQLLESRETRTCSAEKNLRRSKLSKS